MASSNLLANITCGAGSRNTFDPEADADPENWMAEIIHNAVKAWYQIATTSSVGSLRGQRLMQTYGFLLSRHYWPGGPRPDYHVRRLPAGQDASRWWAESGCSCGICKYCA
jgi:hypothetical protein